MLQNHLKGKVFQNGKQRKTRRHFPLSIPKIHSFYKWQESYHFPVKNFSAIPISRMRCTSSRMLSKGNPRMKVR